MATWPAIVSLVDMAIMVLIHAAKDGKPRSDFNILGGLLNAGVTFYILWQGQFFHALGWQ